MSFNGVLFSQSGYNQNLAADIQVETPSGTSRSNIAEGSFVEMKDAAIRIHVVKVVEDVMNMGPGAHLVIEKPGGQEEVWIFKHFEQIKATLPGYYREDAPFQPITRAIRIIFH